MTAYWGHMVVLNSQTYLKEMWIKTLYDTLSKNKNIVAQWNHPDNYCGEASPLSFYSAEYDSVIHLLEIYNGKRSPYVGMYEDEYQAALDIGWHVGPTANSDNHTGTWITGYNFRTAVLAPSLIKDTILNAFRLNRTYATMDKNVKVFYSINGNIMGSVLPDTMYRSFNIRITDPDSLDPLDKIKIIKVYSNHGLLVVYRTFDAHSVQWEFELKRPVEKREAYYYVKVINSGNDSLITAPIWIGDTNSVPDYVHPVVPQTYTKHTLYDLSGRQVKSSQNLPSGIYINARKKVNHQLTGKHLIFID
jgi:hypothetical protein